MCKVSGVSLQNILRHLYYRYSRFLPFSDELHHLVSHTFTADKRSDSWHLPFIKYNKSSGSLNVLSGFHFHRFRVWSHTVWLKCACQDFFITVIKSLNHLFKLSLFWSVKPEQSPAWKHVRLPWQWVIVSYHPTSPSVCSVTAYFSWVLNMNAV